MAVIEVRAAWILRLSGLLVAVVPMAAVAAAKATPAVEDGAVVLSVTSSGRSADELRNAADGWTGLEEAPLHLNLTPPIYEGDPVDDGARPVAWVTLARVQDKLLVRLRWQDPTESRARAPQRVPDGGDERIYKEHSMDIERFADAACVMVPATDGERATYPALMMGDKDAPVSLYYWDAARGFERLRAAGRGSTEPTGESFPGAARRTAGGWEVVLELPAPAPRTPLAFAFWDGERQQRAGLKYFSTWYEVGP